MLIDKTGLESRKNKFQKSKLTPQSENCKPARVYVLTFRLWCQLSTGIQHNLSQQLDTPRMEESFRRIHIYVLLAAARQAFASCVFRLNDGISIEVVFGQLESEIGQNLDFLRRDMNRLTLERFESEVAVPQGSFATSTHHRVVHIKCLWR
jgi:hypothetical protein